MDQKALKEAKDILYTYRTIALEKKEKAIEQCMKNEEYALLNREVKLNTLDISKALANGEDTSGLEKQNADLQKKLIDMEGKILGNIKFFHCPICQDTGMLVNGGYCNCLTEIYKQVLRNKSGVNELPKFTFADNKIGNIDCKQANILNKLYASMQKYCEEFPNNAYKNIFLFGKVGVGKSCVLSATLNELLNKGVNAQYYTAFQLNNIFFKYHTTDIKARGYLLENLINADVLIIDDLGVEPVIKNVTIEYLTAVLMERKNKHTIVATNLESLEIENRYGQRISSRLTDNATSKLLYLDGDDLRHIKQ
ncbi:MAG: ATP-binding protein [Clostridia bacterium]|nr:ATP-binding protein [Clostridia bacterium]